MCGIFGVIDIKDQIDIKKVLEARDVLSHRGPDDEGIYTSVSKSKFNSQSLYIALAHRRLSIIDLSRAGHQPMVSYDSRNIIVFNGEIYNFNYLKNEFLINKKFKSSSDTEVILNLYEIFGTDCLQFLRGMFAFAIWDNKEKILFAARDRFGIKPFYYYKDEKSFVFASELKAIKQYVKNLTISNAALDAFLRSGSVPAPLTIYEEVISLLPGHWLRVEFDDAQNLKLTTGRYWDFSCLLNSSSSYNFELMHKTEQTIRKQQINTNKQASFFPTKSKYDDAAKKKIRSALLNTIETHLVADVEVGVFLSGGIDSTAVVSLMRQCGKEKIKTLSIVFPDSRFDESKYSRLAAKKYNTEHIEIPFYEKDLLDDFENILSVMDQPTIDGINIYFVSKAAKQAGLKVVLSGLGADELFGGYPSFNLIPKYRRIKNLPFAKMFMKFAAPLLKNKLPAKAIHYMRNPDEPNAEYKLVRGLFTDEELKAIGWQDNIYPLTLYDLQPIIEPIGAHKFLPPTQYVSMMETCFYMRDQLLRDSDVFSMAHSIELRVPFVDHLLYEAVLPYLDDAYDKNFPKKMLVEAVGDIPDEIVHRPKMGFTFPFEDWIRNGQLEELMTNSIKNLNSSFNLYPFFFNLNKIHWSRLWALFIMSRWTG
jgi:asparagine synthase (glutamine-hydrolysing)